MALLQDILQGSFKGIPFETYGTEKSKPKKISIHNYPNTKKRIIENLGAEDEVFSFAFSIYGGDEHIDLRNRLETILDEEDAGVLVHPIYGEFNCKCTEWKASDNIQSQLGKADYTATFYVVNESDTINPTVVKNSGISLLNSNIALNDYISSTAGETIIVSNSLNYESVSNKLQSFSSIATNIGNLISDPSDLSTFTRAIQSFDNNISTIISNPATMGTEIAGIFTSLESKISTASSRFTAFQEFFNFGADDSEIVRNTTQRIERQNNNDALNTQIQVNALTVVYNAVPDIDYNNTDDIKEAESITTAQFESLIQSDKLQNSELVNITEITEQLLNSQIEVANVYKSKRQNTPRVISLDVQNSSVALLNYRYYDSLENYDAIADLNPDLVAFYLVENDIKILSDVS